MELIFSPSGTLTLTHKALDLIKDQPIGHLFDKEKIYPPTGCRADGNILHLEFAIGQVDIEVEYCTTYQKLTLRGISGGDGFIYGPYEADLPQFADTLGAAYDGEKAVCIQSLNPKTIGGFPGSLMNSHPYKNKAADDPHRFAGLDSAAFPIESGKTVLQCYVEDMSKPAVFNYLGMKNAIACEVEAEDASPIGSSVALFACDFSDLLTTVEQIELAEGLPHPTIDGKWAKTSPEASRPYIQAEFSAKNKDRIIELTKKANFKCLYNGMPFISWGHFLIDENKIGEGGDDGLKHYSEELKSHGLNSGFHTLTNFIQTHDSYVTPVPDKRLLVLDKTSLAENIDGYETEIAVCDRNNFASHLPVDVIRIDSELIKFAGLDESDGKLILTECERGAFGTSASEHKKGDEVCRLWSHGYGTLFPDFSMMREMEDRLGYIVKYCGIKRLSFDGIEGCAYLGRGEYGLSEFVRRCYELWGSEVLSDASGSSHYRWHAQTYYNWGEPHYNSDRRSGMFNYRANNQAYFKRNFNPPMLGQYMIHLSRGRLEATSPEGFESMMSQSIAYDAGFGLYLFDETLRHGYVDEYFANAAVWDDMRYNGCIPDELRERMKIDHIDWHIEKDDDGWTVSEINTESHDFPYQRITANGKEGDLFHIDCPLLPYPIKCRIKVGTPLENGEIRNPGFHHCWGGDTSEQITFNITAHAGEYLIYNGGTTIERRDKDYNLIETAEGIGVPIKSKKQRIDSLVFTYDTDDADRLSLNAKIFAVRSITKIKRK